jgi:hypothetical protein
MISAEFFDIFGFIGFLILLTAGISLLKIKNAKKQALIIITISLIGLIVDGYVILTNFILN